MRRIATLSAAGLLAAGQARAHAFQGGADLYEQFVQGTAVILIYPGILLPVLAMGIAVSLWDTDGLPRVWPLALLGQVAGIFAASSVGVWVGPAFMALGIGVAALAALWPTSQRVVIAALAAITGLGATAVSLEGHGLFELPVMIHLGILFGINMVLALGAGVSRLALVQVPAPWMQIGWRVAASWIAAILMLFLAFALRGGGIN